MGKGRPWYLEGLCFECQRCGNCCTGVPGYVWVTQAEAQAMAGSLGMKLNAFGTRYLRRVGERLSLVEKPGGDCVFYEEGRCRVYTARPSQCRTYPFWPDMLRTPRDWQAEGRSCAGIGKGRRYSAEEIRAILRGKSDKET